MSGEERVPYGLKWQAVNDGCASHTFTSPVVAKAAS